jgi:hypothetical protein
MQDFQILQFEKAKESPESPQSPQLPWKSFVAYLAKNYTSANLDVLKSVFCGEKDIVNKELFDRINHQLGVFVSDGVENPSDFWTLGKLARLYSQEYVFSERILLF